VEISLQYLWFFDPYGLTIQKLFGKLLGMSVHFVYNFL
jgi:hypothetical protein